MQNYNYEIYTTLDGAEFLKRTDENGLEAFIPMDESNSDYQAYLNKDNPTSGTTTEHVIIDRGNGEFSSMLKATYDELQAKQNEGIINGN